MILDFGREICNNLDIASKREWLVTNGIGGYASGTIAGVLTCRYHGVLIAALKPPLERTLLVSKLDETARYGGDTYPLLADHWNGGVVDPRGFYQIKRFRLEGATPLWTFGLADALLDKRIWMQPGANTTYVRYDLRRASYPVILHIKAIVNYRDHHASTRAGDWRMRVTPMENSLGIMAFDMATPFYLLSNSADAIPKHEWYQNYFLSVEAYRGLDALEENLYAGEFSTELLPGESLTIVVSTEPNPNLDGVSAYRTRQAYDQ